MDDPGILRSAVRFVLWAVAIVGGIWVLVALSGPATDAGFYRYEESLVLLGVAAAVLVAAHFLTGAELDKNLKWLVPIGLLLAFLAFGVYGGHRDRQHGFISDYCKYGAVSDAQLEHCLDHVSRDEIEARETNAARFAKRDIEECRGDAGPFCEDALYHRLAEDTAEP